MEEGFEKAQSNNLPIIDSFMVAEYFLANNDYMAAEVRGVKLQRSGRESYGDDAIGYVQLKRAGNICTVQCRVTPEHKVRIKPYHCVLKCDENEHKVLSVLCEDCAASRGGCKHAVAFLMWLHRRTEEPSTTSVKCYWKKATLSGVGTSVKYIKAKDFGSQVTKKYNNDDFINKIVDKINELGIDCQLSAYFKEKSDVEKLSMHNLIITFIQNEKEYGFNLFLNYCKMEMTSEKCRLVENETKAQANSNLWFEMRYGRITASKAHEAAHCHTQDGTLVEAVFGAKLLVETHAMKRGKLLEISVKNEVEALKNITIKTSGLVLSANFPFLGASPDGVTETHVIEIKCPSNAVSFSTYYKDGMLGKKHYAQIQTQMMLTGKEKGYFCIAHTDFETTKKVDIYEIMYNKDYCKDLFLKISKFWQECIYEKLIKIGNQITSQK